MEKPINPESIEQTIKAADYIRKEFEGTAYGKKPTEQWSDEEKKDFLKHCDFNNFYYTVASLLNEKSGMLEDNGVSIKDEEKISDDELKKIIDLDYSAKYYSCSRGQFYRNIKQALIDVGIDLNELQKTLDKMDEFYNIMVREPESFLKNEDLRREHTNTQVHFYSTVLPAIINLIDGGYTQTELSR